jgi:hypothetical protein
VFLKVMAPSVLRALLHERKRTLPAHSNSLALFVQYLSTKPSPLHSTEHPNHNTTKMAVIWGLDLRDMQWSKFGNEYMWKNTDYHRRRTKFILYQCAMILCVVSESLGTAALSGTFNVFTLLSDTDSP